MNDTEGASLLEAVLALGGRFDALTSAVSDLARDTSRIATIAGRAKRLTTVLFVLVAAVVLLGGWGWSLNKRLADQARAVTNTEAISRNNLLVLCTASNENASAQKELWLPLALVTPANETAAQKKVRLDFLARINKTFAPRDCATVTQ